MQKNASFGSMISAYVSTLTMPTLDRKIQALSVSILIFAIGVFYLLTLRDGHNWGGDFSMYIHHAKNISEGRPYGETGYIYNPSFPFLGPKTYPPVFPLMLVPVYLAAGFDLQAMKLIPIFSFLVALFIIYLNFREKLSPHAVFSIIGVFGFNYFFWDFKDNILSDLPFLLFVYIFFYFAEIAYAKEKSFRDAIKWCLATGFILYVSYGTRSIGIILLPTILLYDLLHNKRVSPRGVLIALCFFILLLVQNFLLLSDRSYFDQLFLNLQMILRNIRIYQWSAITFFSNGHSHLISEWLFIVFSIFTLGGFLFHIKKISIYEIFFLVYAAIIFIWPDNQGMRLLIPIIPLYLYYFFYFFEVVKKKYSNKVIIKNSLAFFICILMSAVAISYCMLYLKQGLPAIRQGIHSYYSLNMFDAVRRESNENDVIIFIKPRVLSLMTSRKSSSYQNVKSDEDLFKYFQKIGATYLIEPINKYPYLQDPYLDSFIARNKNRFKQIYSNRDFIYYRIM